MRRALVAAMALSVLVVAAGADDVDPEPPGGKAALRKLKGTWVSVRMIVKGDSRAHEGATYTFEGDKATYVFRNNSKHVLKFEAKGPGAFQLSRDDGKALFNKYFFKIEKGELHLIVNRSKDPDAKADFSGKTMPVIVYKKQK
jgi:hypothetical protein